MKNILTYTIACILIVLAISSCNNNPCKNVICENEGVCFNGNCICLDSGCKGKRCEICPEEQSFIVEPIEQTCPLLEYGDFELSADSILQQASVKVYFENNNVFADVTYSVEEMGKDSTKASIERTHLLFIVPENFEILDFVDKDKSSCLEFDDNEQIYFCLQPSDEPVKQFELVGKTALEADLGGCSSANTHMTVVFNSIRLQLIKRN